MSSRGSKTTNGHVTTNEYHVDSGKMVYDAKVLVGTSKKQHGLPDYSHSPNSKYIKENSDGSFREMRIYDETGFPQMEIAYHAEERLTGNRHTKVLHFHTFGPGLSRTPAKKFLKLRTRKYMKNTKNILRSMDYD